MTSIIPDQLNIIIRSSIPGFQKIQYKPEMSLKDAGRDDNSVRFNPLYRLNKAAIDKIPEKLRMKQFFNKSLFQSLLYSLKQTPYNNLVQATRAGNVDNNIHLTLQTIFPTNSVIYINKQPYVIADLQWSSGDWKISTKYKQQDVDLDRITDPYLYQTLLGQSLATGEQQLETIPQSVVYGANFTGPKNVGSGIKTQQNQQTINTKSSSGITSNVQSQPVPQSVKNNTYPTISYPPPIKPKQPAGLILPPPTPEQTPSTTPSTTPSPSQTQDIADTGRFELLPDVPDYPPPPVPPPVPPAQQIANTVVQQDSQLNCSTLPANNINNSESKTLRNYFSNKVFYGAINAVFNSMNENSKEYIRNFYLQTTTIDVQSSTQNLSVAAYSQSVDNTSVIKAISDGSCLFDAVSKAINTYNCQPNILQKEKITYGIYGVKQFFTINSLREIALQYFKGLGKAEQTLLFQLSNTYAHELNNQMDAKIKTNQGLLVDQNEYMATLLTIYGNSDDNFLVYKPTTFPTKLQEQTNPFRSITMTELESYFMSTDYWGNYIAMNALCKILRVNTVVFKKEQNAAGMTNYKFKYGNVKTDENCPLVLFLINYSMHFESIQFRYLHKTVNLAKKNRLQSMVKTNSKLISIFDTRDHTYYPPIHMLYLLYGEIYSRVQDKTNFLLYPEFMYIINNASTQLIQNGNIAYNNSFEQLFGQPNVQQIAGAYNSPYYSRYNSPYRAPQYNSPYNSPYRAQQYNMYNRPYLARNMMKRTEPEISKIAYDIIIDMELRPGKSLTPKEMSEAKCNSRWSAVRKAYAEFMGIPYIIKPDYSVYNKKPTDDKNKASTTNKNPSPKPNPNANQNTKRNNRYPINNQTRRYR